MPRPENRAGGTEPEAGVAASGRTPGKKKDYPVRHRSICDSFCDGRPGKRSDAKANSDDPKPPQPVHSEILR